MSEEFRSLVSRAMTLMESDQRDEALAAAREAETCSHDPEDDLETLSARNNLGIIFFQIGYNEAAEHAYLIAAAGKALTPADFLGGATCAEAAFAAGTAAADHKARKL